MPLVIGLLSRALLAIVFVGGAALVARLYMDGLLSRTQLEGAVADLAHQVGTAAAPLLHSRKLFAAVIFSAGAIFGWIAAFSWNSSRSRRRPLIIADLRNADMPFSDGILHVRVNALPPVENDMAAMWLILAEAGRGRLTLWRRASANTLRRVSRRSVRAAAVRMAHAASPDMNAVASWNVDPWHALMLLAPEMEQLWPSQPDTRLKT